MITKASWVPPFPQHINPSIKLQVLTYLRYVYTCMYLHLQVYVRVGSTFGEPKVKFGITAIMFELCIAAAHQPRQFICCKCCCSPIKSWCGCNWFVGWLIGTCFMTESHSLRRKRFCPSREQKCCRQRQSQFQKSRLFLLKLAFYLVDTRTVPFTTSWCIIQDLVLYSLQGRGATKLKYMGRPSPLSLF